MTCELKAGTDELTLPEVSEAIAPESVQAIYRDIRRLSGVPMVALIFRHIATYPEILEEVWTSIGPLFRGGRIQDAAWRIAKLVSLAEPLPRLEPDTRDVLGLAGDDLERIQNTLDAHNRANPVNLLAILSLLARVQTDAPAVAPQERELAAAACNTGSFTTNDRPRSHGPTLRWLINNFGFGDRSKLDPVVPSLFRHLAHWPKYLATLHVSLLPRFRDLASPRRATICKRAARKEPTAMTR
jgi:hypothetical protein